MSASPATTTVRVSAARPLEARALTALLAEYGLGRDDAHADVVVVAAPPWGLDAPTRRLITAVARTTRSVVVADADPGSLLDAVSAGAHGYVTWGQSARSIVEAVHTVARGEALVPPGMLGGLLRGLIERNRVASDVAERYYHLTDRERETLTLLCDGLDASAIAARLYVSVQTVRSHIQRLLGKFEVHSQLEAVSLVLDHGLVTPADDDQEAAS